MNDSDAQQAWWDSMSDEQREAYEDAIVRRRAEAELKRDLIAADAEYCGDENS